MKARRGKKNTQSGRSMVEMLAVLAIVGVLSIGSFAALRIAWAKAKANAIVHDGRLVFVESTTNHEEGHKDWTPATFGTESGKDFYMMRDIQRNNFVKVEGVEDRVCEQMLLMQKEGELKFLTTDDADFTECEGDDNVMVMAFDGLGLPRQCNERFDCGENFQGRCNFDGRCVGCDETYEEWNEALGTCDCNANTAQPCSDEETGYNWCCPSYKHDCGVTPGTCKDTSNECVTAYHCQDIGKTNHYCDTEHQCIDCGDYATIDVDNNTCRCNAEQAIACTDGTAVWCCGKDANNNPQVCDIANKGCQAPGRFCHYHLDTSGFSIERKVHCAYDFDIGNFRIDRSTECAYRVSTVGEGENARLQLTAEPNKACSGGTYCALTYADEGCNSYAGAGAAVIYGNCLPTNNFTPTCTTTPSGSFSFTPVVDKTNGRDIDICGEGTYCALTYADEECNSYAGAGAARIYGDCLPTDNFTPTCTTTPKGAIEFAPYPGEECPAQTFCSITWSSSSCANAGAGATELYGVCQELNVQTAPSSCPPAQ